MESDFKIKEPVTCTNPLLNDWKFCAKVNTPFIKPLPDFAKTDEEIAKYVRYDMADTAANAIIKAAIEMCEDGLRKATERSRKHRIFIACPSYRDIRKYVEDLIYSLRLRGINAARADMMKGEVETLHVIAKMIPPMMCRDGLRCDECFGFTCNDGKRLKNSYWPGYDSLLAVPGYIEKIEKEKTKEMKDNFSQLTAAFAGIAKPVTPNKPSAPTIKDVIFNDPATIVMWSDGTKTVVKAKNEDFDPEKGLAMAISKKNLGNKYDYYNTFKHWIKKYCKDHPDYGRHWKVPSEPVHKAYQALVNIMSTKGTKLNTKTALEEAIEEAIGFLGEALDD